ncbi:MAG: RNA 2',3'-cyclic phosphodiesterase [Anaerolineae bacterium]|nr:RNA 2',3'-cyclic phosphodiesterase [Anaerolineae bacterium]
MTSIRSFIAIELSDEVRDQLAKLQGRLKSVVLPNAVRWTAPQKIHLTLHFLGDVAMADLEQIAAALEAATSTCPPFSVTLAGLGCFPNTHRPRIVWTGVTGELETLVKLHQDLGEQLKQGIGFIPESRPYSPHLTIGRIKKDLPRQRLAQLGQALELEQSRVGQLARLEVRQVSLIKSELKPDGPVYTPLAQGILRQ